MPKTKTKKSKKIFLVLRIAVVTAGIICFIMWVSRGDRWSKLISIFRQMNLGVFAVTLSIFVVTQVMVGFRWWLLLRTQSIFISLPAAVRLNFLGWFYNNFMPGSVGGDLLRAWYVTKHTAKKFEAVLSVFIDRVIGLLSTFVIALFFYMFFLRGRGPVITSTDRNGFFESIAAYKQVLLCVFASIVVISCILLIHKKGRSMLEKLWLYIRARAITMIVKFKDAIVIYCRNIGTILVVFGLTVFLQLLTITGFWLLGRNLGIEASVVYYYVFFTITWVLGAIPGSIACFPVYQVRRRFCRIRLRTGPLPEGRMDACFSAGGCDTFGWGSFAERLFC